VVTLPDAQNVYHNPGAPVYVVQGTAGAVLDYEKWIPATNWSLVRDGDNYGFGESGSGKWRKRRGCAQHQGGVRRGEGVTAP
jgi:hypothetical protein